MMNESSIDFIVASSMLHEILLPFEHVDICKYLCKCGAVGSTVNLSIAGVIVGKTIRAQY